MFDDHNPHGDKNEQPGAPPSGAPPSPGAALNSNTFVNSDHNQNHRAPGGGAVEEKGGAQGGAMASERNTTYFNVDDMEWPPKGGALDEEGAAVLTTKDARIYLFRVHDIYLRDRYTQKLVKEYKLLHGKKFPKSNGGVKLQITVQSLDIYAEENPDKKIVDKVVIPRDDDAYTEFLEISYTKSYDVIFEGAALENIETPTETPPAALEDDVEPGVEDIPENKRPAPLETEAPTETPPDAIPREMFDLVKNNLEYFKNLFENQQTKTERSEEGREQDRNDLEDKLKEQKRDHEEKVDAILSDLTAATNTAIQLKIDNITLKAAYNEAVANLPPGTQLSTDVSDTINPDQPELTAPKQPIQYEITNDQGLHS